MSDTFPETSKISISKQQLAELPAVDFDGKITVINNAADAKQAISYLEKVRLVGFDTETRPSFKKGVRHNVALIQISTIDHAFLFRINKFGLSTHMRKFIENPEIIKIGLSLKDDFSVLHHNNEFNPDGFIDLQEFVKQYHIADASLSRIYGIIFGNRISKAQRLTNWEAPQLTDAQQKYASIDAWACLKIYNHLLEGKFNPEQSQYIIQPEIES